MIRQPFVVYLDNGWFSGDFNILVFQCCLNLKNRSSNLKVWIKCMLDEISHHKNKHAINSKRIMSSLTQATNFLRWLIVLNVYHSFSLFVGMREIKT